MKEKLATPIYIEEGKSVKGGIDWTGLEDDWVKQIQFIDLVFLWQDTKDIPC